MNLLEALKKKKELSNKFSELTDQIFDQSTFGSPIPQDTSKSIISAEDAFLALEILAKELAVLNQNIAYTNFQVCIEVQRAKYPIATVLAMIEQKRRLRQSLLDLKTKMKTIYNQNKRTENKVYCSIHMPELNQYIQAVEIDIEILTEKVREISSQTELLEHTVS